MIESLWKRVRQFLKKLNINVPYDATISLLEIHSREIKTNPNVWI